MPENRNDKNRLRLTASTLLFRCEYNGQRIRRSVRRGSLEGQGGTHSGRIARNRVQDDVRRFDQRLELRKDQLPFPLRFPLYEELIGQTAFAPMKKVLPQKALSGILHSLKRIVQYS